MQAPDPAGDDRTEESLKKNLKYLEKIKELEVQAWITTTNPELFLSLKEDALFLRVENNTVVS